jgi:hypothetical protein
MPKTMLKLWEFGDAPEDLRRLVPAAYADGWVVLISPGAARDLVDCVVTRWLSSGFSFVRHDVEDGRIIFAGPHCDA